MTPVIIDTDPGVDDAVAILLAAASREVALLAITTVFGNVDLATTTANALRLRSLAGLGHVPVAAGAARPFVHPQREHAAGRHGADGLGGCADLLPAPEGPVHARGAVALMADLLRSATEPVTLVPIGPLTNVALLLAAHPDVKPRIARIVAMGGCLTDGDTADVGTEFNVHCDPEAARRVLVEEDVPTTLVPLDLTLRCAVTGEWRDELATAGPRSALLVRLIEHHRTEHRATSGRDRVPLHDSLAVLEAAVPGTLRTTPMPLDVVCAPGTDRGRTVRAAAGRTIDVALDADVAAVSAAILQRLRALR
ncbi:MAG: nucleoside hydrolase [Pseudonocardiaceae bacterium]